VRENEGWSGTAHQFCSALDAGKDARDPRPDRFNMNDLDLYPYSAGESVSES
jgi:hypothetical protein